MFAATNMMLAPASGHGGGGGGGTLPVASFSPDTAGKSTWQLVFEDLFPGTSIDTTKWQPLWYTTSGPNNVTTTPSNISVSGGVCTLTLSSSSIGACMVTRPAAHAGGNGVTPGFDLPSESVFEARCLFPGNGSSLYNWSAFWVLHDESDGAATMEFDIAENLQGNTTSSYHLGYPTVIEATTHNTTDAYYGGAYHVWTYHRGTSNDYVYIDGVLKWTHAQNASDPHATARQYVLLNIGNGQSNPVQTGSAGAMLVDYVRSWSPA
jgi:hypothetical protein